MKGCDDCRVAHARLRGIKCHDGKLDRDEEFCGPIARCRVANDVFSGRCASVRHDTRMSIVLKDEWPAIGAQLSVRRRCTVDGRAAERTGISGEGTAGSVFRAYVLVRSGALSSDTYRRHDRAHRVAGRKT